MTEQAILNLEDNLQGIESNLKKTMNGVDENLQTLIVQVETNLKKDIYNTLNGSSSGTYVGTFTGPLTGNSSGIHTGNVTGDLTGNVTGDLTGDLTGNVIGDLTGNVTGDLTGDLTGNVIGDLTGNVTGDLTGNVTGDLTGNVTGDLTGDLTGNVTGDLTGNVTGDLTGNVTGDLTGNVTGDLTGNVTGDLTGNVTGDLTGNVTGDLTGDLTGNVTGDLTGNVTGDLTGNVTGDLTGNVIGDLNISGNLHVEGDATYVNVSNLQVEDNIIEIGTGVDGVDLIADDGLDRGIIFHYYDSSKKEASIKFDSSNASPNTFTLISDGSTKADLDAGEVTATGFVGNLTGNADTVTNGVYTTSKLSVLAATSSSELAGVISDETGTGALVFANSPTLVTPALGTPASGVLTNCTGTASGLTAGTASVATTVTITDNENTNEENAIIFAAGGDVDGGNLGLESDGTLTYNPSTGKITATGFIGALTGNADTVTNGVYTTSKLSVLAATSSSELAGVISDETGTGALVFANSPTLVTPALGTPASGVLTNCTGTASGLTAGTASVATTVTITDNENTNENNAIIFAAGGDVDGGNLGLESDGTLTYNPSTGKITATGFIGALTGNADTATKITSITNSDIVQLTETQTLTNKTLTSPTLTTPALGTPTAGVLTNCTGTASGLTAGTASVATTVTITDNENTNENNAIIFAAGGDVDGGNLGLESDGTLTYNPSTGKITATGFIGALTGNADTVTNGVYTTSKLSVLAATSSSELAGVISDETGTGALVFANSPTLVTPALGTPASGVLTNCTGTASGLTAGTASVATTVTITDNENTNENNAIIFAAGGDVDGGNLGLESDGTLTYNPSTGKITATGFIGALTGNADTATKITSITNSDIVQLTETQTLTNKTLTSPTLTTPALGTPTAGVLTNCTGTASGLTAGTASVATTVTITDNENTNENNAIIFAAGGDVDGGNLGLESDGTLTYNPSTGKITATGFIGALTGNADTATKITSITNSDIVQLTETQTLTNKTLTSPTLTTPALGTPTAGVLTNCTGTASGLTAGTASVATTVTITDNENTNENNAIIFAAGGDVDGGNLGLESDGTLTYNPSTGKITATGFIGALTGNADTATKITSITNSDIVQLTETQTLTNKTLTSPTLTTPALGTPTAGVLTNCTGTAANLTAGTASVATTVTITDNENTNEENAIIFAAGGDVDGGNLGLESDGTLTYNPSTGKITATGFIGALTGNADTVTNGVYTTSKLSVLAATSSSELAGVISDETGTGALVFANSPTLVTPALGTPASGVLTNCTGTASGLTAGTASVATTVTITDNENTNENNAIIFAAGGDVDGGNLGLESDGTLTYNPSTGKITATGFIGALTGNADTVTNGVYTTSKLSVLAATSSSELAGVISDETGTGALVFANSPTLVTPALGTPASGVLTNCIGTAAGLTAGTASVATTVTITDNENTNEENAIIFAAGGDVDGGNLGLESDGTLTYNPSTGKITATGFIGTTLSSGGALAIDTVTTTALSSGTTFDIQATGNLTMDSSGGSIGIGTDGVTGAINIGTNAHARTITVGNDASTKVDVNALAIELDSAGTTTGAISLASAGGITLSTAAASPVIVQDNHLAHKAQVVAAQTALADSATIPTTRGAVGVINADTTHAIISNGGANQQVYLPAPTTVGLGHTLTIINHTANSSEVIAAQSGSTATTLNSVVTTTTGNATLTGGDNKEVEIEATSVYIASVIGANEWSVFKVGTSVAPVNAN